MTSPRLCGTRLVGHADGDPAGAVDEQVRKRSREHDGFVFSTVVVLGEIDNVLVKPAGQFQRRRGQARLGVTHSGRAIVERPEIAVAIDQGKTQGERLGKPNQRVVNR